MCDRIIDCNDGADIRNCSFNIPNVIYLSNQDIPTTCPETQDTLGVCMNATAPTIVEMETFAVAMGAVRHASTVSNPKLNPNLCV